MPRKSDSGLDMNPQWDFASDNTAGMCPEALDAILRANEGLAPSYGDDPWTHAVADALRGFFEADCDVYFVATGTAANSLALSALCASYHSVIAHELAHIETDECGAPEFFSNGSKLLTAPGVDGKLTPATVEGLVTRRADIHYPKPRVLSLSQATECGTLYTIEETKALAEVARARGLRVHMDGARFANAAVALGAAPADLTWRAGVDVLCLSGAKNGLAIGEAILFFDRSLSVDFAWRCKQAGHLLSKMRFLAAPWRELVEGGAWRRNAAHANAMAARLRAGLENLGGVAFAHPTQANGVFVRLPEAVIQGLRGRGWRFYTFIGQGFARFMCSWNTRPEDVDRLLADLRALC